MKDETKGIKTNRVGLNLPHYPSLEPPEPGIAAVTIDGVPIHAVRGINIQAGVEILTICTISFECEVTGVVGIKGVDEIIREASEK